VNKLIVGLGNPEPEYKDTRHNIGFRVIDELIKKYRKCGQEGSVHGIPFFYMSTPDHIIYFIKPQCGMNSSGSPICKAMNIWTIDIKNVLVIHDDMDFEPGIIRIKFSGGDGRHNGLKSIIGSAGKEFGRVRLGVGRPSRGEAIDHVLSTFTTAEEKTIQTAICSAVNAVECYINNDIYKTMNQFNQKENV
jgi:PTH1 family peptidyl-tRNA hydrolase